MRCLVLISAFIGGLLCTAVFAHGPEPVLKGSIPLPGVAGRIDHLAFDPHTKRLFVAALENGSLEAIDVEKRERVKSVSGLKEPQGVVYVPTTKQVVVACGGDGILRAYDPLTLDEKQRLDLSEDADNVRLDSDSKTIVVGHGSGALAIVDAATFRRTGDIKLAHHPEAFTLEPRTPRVFTNTPGGTGSAEIAVADRTTLKVMATWVLKEAGRNFPMALDAAHKRLYVGCRKPSKLLVIDIESGKVVASPECVGDADEVFVDSKTGRVLVVGGEGAIDVFETGDHQMYTKAGSVRTAPGARTALLVPERRAIYVAIPKRSEQPAEIREYALSD